VLVDRVDGGLEEVAGGDAGISTGYWNARNTPSRAPLFAESLEQVLALVVDGPSVTS
jgi:hypothetical protein